MIFDLTKKQLIKMDALIKARKITKQKMRHQGSVLNPNQLRFECVEMLKLVDADYFLDFKPGLTYGFEFFAKFLGIELYLTKLKEGCDLIRSEDLSKFDGSWYGERYGNMTFESFFQSSDGKHLHPQPNIVKLKELASELYSLLEPSDEEDASSEQRYYLRFFTPLLTNLREITTEIALAGTEQARG